MNNLRSYSLLIRMLVLVMLLPSVVRAHAAAYAVGVTVNLADYGSNNETIGVSIFFNSTLVATRTNIPVFLN